MGYANVLGDRLSTGPASQPPACATVVLLIAGHYLTRNVHDIQQEVQCRWNHTFKWFALFESLRSLHAAA